MVTFLGESINTGLDYWNGGLVEWWTTGILEPAIIVAAHVITRTRHIMCFCEVMTQERTTWSMDGTSVNPIVIEDNSPVKLARGAEVYR